MPKVIFIDKDEAVREVAAQAGSSLMETAVRNRVVGVLAECGGACACATCHVYIDPAWAARVPPPAAFESAMVAEALDTRETSRLACQITMTDALDGLVVRVPKRQV